MKKCKAMLAILLVVCMFATLFAACGSSETAGDSGSAGSSGVADNSTNSDNGSSESSGSPVDFDEEPAHLRVVLYDHYSLGGDNVERIQAAVNEITLKTINTEVDLWYVDAGNWNTQIVASLAGGDQIDVLNQMFFSQISDLVSKGMVQPITEYVDEYAPGALEACKDYMGPYTFGGEIYGFPTLRNFVRNGYIVMRTDMLEEMGLVEQAEAIDSWSDYEAIMQAVYDNYTSQGAGIYATAKSSMASYDYVSTSDDFKSNTPVDTLGDFTNTIYTMEDGVVRCFQESDAWINAWERSKDWLDKGYLWPDSEFSEEQPDDLMMKGVTFSIITAAEEGVKAIKEAAYGFEVTVVNTAIGMINTSKLTFVGCSVPSTCDDPEAACRFINELYTNADLMNVLVWGIEGEDYTMVDGEVVSNDGGWTNGDWTCGNNMLLKPLQGNGVDFYDNVQKILDQADVSTFLGFNIDSEDMMLYMANLSAVTDQFNDHISYGGYTEEYFQEYITKLEAAGIRDYIASVQTQLDAWLASQN